MHKLKRLHQNLHADDKDEPDILSEETIMKSKSADTAFDKYCRNTVQQILRDW